MRSSKPTKSMIIYLSLLLCSISLLFTTSTAQTCTSHTFANNAQFSSCSDLPALNSFLYWTYDANAATANIAFRVTGISTSSNWIAWALNPSGSGMAGAQALVAFQNSTSIQAYTSSVASTSITALTPSTLSFQVTNISATTTGTSEMTLFATITPPRTTVNHVWQVGQVSSGAPGAHPLGSANRASVGTIDFLSGQSTAGTATIARLGRKNAHGVINTISWGILMPLGAIIARYMKVFKSADPAWFYIHVTCQFSAYVIGVAGWGTGLKLGSDSPGIVYQTHRNLGIALFCLATLQVFALLLRPKKDHKFRLYWNIYHHCVGYTVLILSIVNIYQGFDHVLQPEEKWKRAYTGIIIALGAIALGLEAFTWIVVLKRNKDNPDKNAHHANGTNGYSNGYTTRTQPAV